jgi:Sigma-70 factor, region 1.1
MRRCVTTSFPAEPCSFRQSRQSAAQMSEDTGYHRKQGLLATFTNQFLVRPTHVTESSHMSDDMPDPQAFGTRNRKSPRPTAEEIERLKEMGRRRGHVTLDQIKSVLPIEQMSGEEVGEAMARLEWAGIDVQIDPEFLRSRADMQSDVRSRARPTGPSKANLAGIRSTPVPSPTSKTKLARGAGPATGRWMGRTPVTVAVALIVAIVCALLIFALFWR